MKIFWSWQSDTPGKIGRFLVRDALQEAIELLKNAPDIEEPTTKENREALHLDHDVKGVTGSPDLAKTIFDKIDVSEVVIADVTLVGHMPDTVDANKKPVPGKKLINSNVAIELGYALRAVTDKHVLMVFNEHYGKHEMLPFDLRHKGGSITFDLAPDAASAKIEAEKKKLKAQFVAKLKPYLGARAAAPAQVEETPSTFSRATYFQQGETLAQVGVPDEDEVSYSYEGDIFSYIRLIPTKRLERPLPLALLVQEVQHAPLISRQFGGLRGQNNYGAMICEPGSNPPHGRGKLNASTQLFQNGEIWSIGANLIVTERGQRPQWIKLPALPSLLFEQAYYDKLRGIIDFASKRLGLSPPWLIECGLSGIKGLNLLVPPEDFFGPVRKTEISHRMVLNDAGKDAVDAFLLVFFNAVYDATGYARPAALHGFPPARPTYGGI